MRFSSRDKVVSVLLVVCFLPLLIGCKKTDNKLHRIEQKDFLRYWNNNDSVKDVWGEKTSETMGRPGYKTWVSLNGATFAHYEFDDYLDAQVFFEDEWYKPLVAFNQNSEFSGYFYNYFEEGNIKLSTSLEKRYTGILLFNGKVHSEDQRSDVYGGAFLFDNTVVIAYTKSPSAENMKNIEDFLKQFEYPVPKER